MVHSSLMSIISLEPSVCHFGFFAVTGFSESQALIEAFSIQRLEVYRRHVALGSGQTA